MVLSRGQKTLPTLGQCSGRNLVDSAVLSRFRRQPSLVSRTSMVNLLSLWLPSAVLQATMLVCPRLAASRSASKPASFQNLPEPLQNSELAINSLSVLHFPLQDPVRPRDSAGYSGG